jgi:hypothetical protein
VIGNSLAGKLLSWYSFTKKIPPMQINKMLATCAIAMLMLISANTFAQNNKNKSTTGKKTETTMKTYLIERDIPGAGSLTPEQLKGISQASCTVLKEMGPKIEWLHSYVAGDKVFCVYKAENEALVKTHGEKGGFPITSIKEISTTISPATAQQ